MKKFNIFLAVIGGLVVSATAFFLVADKIDREKNKNLTVISSQDISNPRVVTPEKNPCRIKEINGQVKTSKEIFDIKIDFVSKLIMGENSDGRYINSKIKSICSNNFLLIGLLGENGDKDTNKCFFQGDIIGNNVAGFYRCKRIEALNDGDSLWSGVIIE